MLQSQERKASSLKREIKIGKGKETGARAVGRESKVKEKKRPGGLRRAFHNSHKSSMSQSDPGRRTGPARVEYSYGYGPISPTCSFSRLFTLFTSHVALSCK